MSIFKLINHKLFKIFMVMLMIISSMQMNFSFAYAASATLDRSTDTEGYMVRAGIKDNLGTTHSSGNPKTIFKIGNKYAYCLESDVDVTSSNYSQTDGVEDILQSGRVNKVTTWRQKYTMISALLTYLPSQVDKDNRTEHIKWLVGQTMIWEITGEERGANFVYKGVTTSGASPYRSQWKWTDSSAKKIFDDFYAEVEEKMLNYWKIPSFTASSQQLAKTYEFTSYNDGTYSITLEDTNQVLNNFEFKAEGLTFTKSDNRLTVSTKQENIDNVIIECYKTSSNEMRAPLFWQSGSSQKIVTSGDIVDDPQPYGYFKLSFAKGAIKITKKDNKGNTVANTSFQLSYHADMSNPIGTYQTGQDGTVTIDNLECKTVYIQEVAVLEHLVLDKTVESVVVKSLQTVSYTKINQTKQGYIQVTKKDNKTKQIVQKSGIIFEVLSGNKVVETITTNNEGIAKTGKLDYGVYSIKEKENPENYTIAEVNQETSILENGKTYEVEIFNEPVTGQIHLTKVDSELGKVSQGDASLIGAQYTLIANQTILNPADGSVLYEKDEVIVKKTVGKGQWGDVGLKTIDKNLSISWSNLPMGEYKIVETKAPTGYLADNDIIVKLTQSSQTESTVTVHVESQENVKKQSFRIMKISTDGQEDEADKVAGAEFTVKLESEVAQVGWDNAKIYDVIVTDENGEGTSIRLPYGTYRVKETKVPDDLYQVEDFFITVQEDSQQPQSWKILNDAPFKALVRAVKLDKQTQKTISLENTSFKVKNLDTGKYVGFWVWLPIPHYVTTFKTDESGTVTLPETLKYGHYQLEEVVAPEGYTLDQKAISFTISKSGAYEIADDGMTPIITVYKEDESVKGIIEVYKKGEVLTDYQDGQFIYEERGLAGAEYSIYAREDILDPSHDGTILFAKDSLVTTMTSGSDGKAKSEELPLGQYYIKESKAPYGYILSDKITDVELKYVDDSSEHSIVYERVEYTNERQKVSILSSKQDNDSKEYLSGMEATLYANRDIYNYDGEIIVEAGTALETIITDKNGKATFSVDLPNDLTPQSAIMPIVDEGNDTAFNNISVDGVKLVGNPNSLFVVKETKQPNGYVPLEVNYYIDTTYTSQDESLLEFETSFYNEITVVEISKQDATTGHELPGASLEVIDFDTGETVEQWTSTDESHIIKGLTYNKEYILKETIAPEGYAVSSKIRFTVGDYTKVIMRDELKTLFSKQDINGEEIPGAKITVTQKDTGEIIDEWISDEEPHMIVGLKNNTAYVMKETVAANGYVQATDIEFVAGANNHHIVMIDKQVQVLKIDQMNHYVEGAKLQVVDKETGEVVETITTKNQAMNLNHLIEGKTYILKEIECPDHYNKAQDIEFNVTTAKENQMIKMIDVKTDDVSITKYDAASSQEIPGAHLQLSDSQGHIVEEWISTESEYIIKGLIVGEEYTLHETIAPKGYTIASDIQFVVLDNNEVVQQIKMYDEPVHITKTSDSTPLFVYYLLFGISFVCIIQLLKKTYLV